MPNKFHAMERRFPPHQLKILEFDIIRNSWASPYFVGGLQVENGMDGKDLHCVYL